MDLTDICLKQQAYEGHLHANVQTPPFLKEKIDAFDAREKKAEFTIQSATGARLLLLFAGWNLFLLIALSLATAILKG